MDAITLFAQTLAHIRIAGIDQSALLAASLGPKDLIFGRWVRRKVLGKIEAEIIDILNAESDPRIREWIRSCGGEKSAHIVYILEKEQKRDRA